MRQNPCRYCALSYEHNGKHSPGYRENCFKCENLKKHKEYLQSQRMFVSGDTITSISELLEQEWVICGTVTRHIEVLKSMSLRTVLMFLDNGSIKKAIKRESEE